VRRWLREEDRGLFLALVVLTVVIAVLMFRFSGTVSGALLLVPLLLTDMLLTPRRVPSFVGVLLLVLLVTTLIEFEARDIPARRWIALAVVVLMSLVVLAVARRRAQLGVGGLTGESMFLDLKHRLSRQGDLTRLPAGWAVEVAKRSADETSFAGDFMVAHHDEELRTLSMVVVDVSGKGVAAGTRSLLLSGAFGGLLGAVSAERFFPAANEFLLGQAWEEGFATAVHVRLETVTGRYEVRSAGHPPAIHFHAGSGQWEVRDEDNGPILGVLRRPEFPALTGRLVSGDALLLFTDGLVERPGRDISLGVDRLIGEGERVLPRGMEGAAGTLVDRLATAKDDCALVILQRR
jgi:hypothetical protein